MPTVSVDEAKRRLEKGEAILARQEAEGKVDPKVVWGVEALRAAIRKAIPPEPDPDPCRCCGNIAWWESIHGVRVCGVCHPPASLGLVRRGIGLIQ